MSTGSGEPLSRTQLDKLGNRLRAGTADEADLRALDEYRRSFRSAYDEIVATVKAAVGLEGTGRPAKTTAAIIDKLQSLHRELTMVFLIQYDRRAGQMTSLEVFSDSDRTKAESVRLTLELSTGSSTTDREIVLLEATSEAELRKTHRRYFESAQELVKSAADEAAASSRPS